MVDYASASEAGFKTGMAAGNRFSAIENSLRGLISAAMEKKREDNKFAHERMLNENDNRAAMERLQAHIQGQKEIAAAERATDIKGIAWTGLLDVSNKLKEKEGELFELQEEINNPDGSKTKMVLKPTGKSTPIAGRMKEGFTRDVRKEEQGWLVKEAAGKALATTAGGLLFPRVGPIVGNIMRDTFNALRGTKPSKNQKKADLLRSGIPEMKEVRELTPEAQKEFQGREEQILREANALNQKRALYYGILAGGGSRQEKELSAADIQKQTAGLEMLQKGFFVKKQVGGILEKHPIVGADKQDIYSSMFDVFGLTPSMQDEVLGEDILMVDPIGETAKINSNQVDDYLEAGWRIVEKK